MAESFNVNEYWLSRGQSYIKEQRLAGPYHRLQEQFLLKIIREGGISASKILEIGCGFGRITKLLAEQLPEAQITALDLSPDQINNARAYCGEKPNVAFEVYDFYSAAPFPGQAYDLGIAIEVFLHHPADLVSRLITNLAQVSTLVLNVDWSEPWPWSTPDHVWVHDFEKLYHQANLKCLAFVLPQKVDGKQQKLFVAGRYLPPCLIALQQELNPPDHHAVDPPEDWLRYLHRAEIELRTIVPRGSNCILVDENHWGEARKKLDRHILPFLERDGEYWGLPVDDAHAIRELERMRTAGAEYLVFPWHSFWWLEHYRHLADHLRSAFPCVAKTDQLLVFKLN